MALSCGLGGAGLLAFGLFLAIGPVTRLSLGMGRVEALELDAALSLLFFLQHSGMVRRRWQRFLGRRVTPAYLPALYSAASGAAALAVVLLWQELDPPLFRPEGWGRWAWRGGWVLGGGLMLWSWRALGSLDALGVQPILQRLRRIEPPAAGLHIRGPYRWVRHPMYLAVLLMIWSYPDLSADRLLFNGLWSAWICVGARLEERDLAAAFGAPYHTYQQRVPMLVPRRRPVPDAGHGPLTEGEGR
ncbi:MAG: isoprenylcysteine carboxylmethyltransferase family protein [Gemmatimonadota bacterium]